MPTSWEAPCGCKIRYSDDMKKYYFMRRCKLHLRNKVLKRLGLFIKRQKRTDTLEAVLEHSGRLADNA